MTAKVLVGGDERDLRGTTVSVHFVHPARSTNARFMAFSAHTEAGLKGS
jgi:hypothetical protein